MYVLSAFYGIFLSFLFFFSQKKLLLLKWHLELFTLIYELGSTGKTVVLVQYKDFLHRSLKTILKLSCCYISSLMYANIRQWQL